jgi:hypothetical protein
VRCHDSRKSATPRLTNITQSLQGTGRFGALLSANSPNAVYTLSTVQHTTGVQKRALAVYRRALRRAATPARWASTRHSSGEVAIRPNMKTADHTEPPRIRRSVRRWPSHHGFVVQSHNVKIIDGEASVLAHPKQIRVVPAKIRGHAVSAVRHPAATPALVIRRGYKLPEYGDRGSHGNNADTQRRPRGFSSKGNLSFARDVPTSLSENRAWPW